MSLRTLLLSSVLGLVLAAPAAAQMNPIPRMPDRNAERARYVAEARTGVNQLITDLQGAWRRGDARALARLHTADAVVIRGQVVLNGREAIEESYLRLLPPLDNVRPSVTDFDVGGSLAYVFGTMALGARPGSATAPASSTYVLIARMEGRNWRIRSLVIDTGGAE